MVHRYIKLVFVLLVLLLLLLLKIKEFFDSMIDFIRSAIW
jgi:hypothetical protein